MELDLNGSFKPITILTKLFTGVSIMLSSTAAGDQGKHYYFWIAYSCLIILGNVFSNIIYFKNLDSRPIDWTGNKEEKTGVLINNIYYFNLLLYCLGVHNYFFCISLTKSWKEMWTILKDIETQLNFNKKFYRKCRNSVLLGSFTVLSVHKKFFNLFC